ncbi:hypothetical Protein YC6258_04832 [Gynuella sunshinyii YC6258]|uniref:Uncharacterized protein n=1 Tax=Gynuella sunshinyii YC6258 TaxID=1445510 RepID=A0A0C5W2G0_9GAMM|nr:hypothetical Protein YC6258_04832 [Gynuella sunshinyii YC6258]
MEGKIRYSNNSLWRKTVQEWLLLVDLFSTYCLLDDSRNMTPYNQILFSDRQQKP